MIWHVARDALALGPFEVVVVVRPDLPEITGALGGLPVRCVPNPRYEQGMGTSLAAGIAALQSEVEAVIVLLGDMPYVARDVIERLVSASLSERKPVTMPLYGSEVGPPTIFARQVFPELLRLEGEAGGRQLIAARPEIACLVPFREDERPPDIDTVEDYRRINDSQEA